MRNRRVHSAAMTDTERELFDALSRADGWLTVCRILVRKPERKALDDCISQVRATLAKAEGA